ncbi:hypothetical protein DL96DRAFT_1703791 [Flagelloscypha sp. PMI_526]|nr:hypothetical protein DL96DRAFT_1703791 [Flagelloscypha sp. PMI_526]
MTVAYRGPYIDHDEARKSYYKRDGSMSQGMLRARRSYRVKNAITGVLLGAFVVGVWAYSIRAVKQEIFDDVDEEAKQLAAISSTPPSSPSTSTTSPTSNTTLTHASPSPSAAKLSVNPIQHDATMVDSTKPFPPLPPPRGLLVGSWLDRTFPTLLDPAHKTMVWKAPSVDRVGRTGESYYS